MCLSVCVCVYLYDVTVYSWNAVIAFVQMKMHLSIIGSRRNSTHTHILLYDMITFHVIIGSGRNGVSMYACMYITRTYAHTCKYPCLHTGVTMNMMMGDKKKVPSQTYRCMCVCVACVCVCRLCVYILCTRLTQSHTSTRTTTGAAKDLCAGVQLLPRNHLADIPH